MGLLHNICMGYLQYLIYAHGIHDIHISDLHDICIGNKVIYARRIKRYMHTFYKELYA